MLKFEEIISKFQIEGEITDVKPLGHGTDVYKRQE